MLKDLTISSALAIAALLVCVLGALFAPMVAPHGESEMVGNVWAPMSMQYPFGLDNLGRDILSRLLYGARTTITIALITTILAFLIGTNLGFIAAISGGLTDNILSRIVEVIMSIPGLVISLLVLCLVGTSITTLILTVAAVESMRVFRLSRNVAAGIVKLEYIEAARMRGERLVWIITKEVLPNAAVPLIAAFGLSFTYTVLFIASLSFLGLGIQPPAADWGGMVRDNAPAINLGSFAPVLPAIAIAMMTVSTNLLVDWLLTIRSRQGGR